MRSLPPENEQQILDAHARLLDEFRAAWSELDNLLARLEARPWPSAVEPLEACARDWLLTPLQAMRRARPLERVLEAIEAHGQWRRELRGDVTGLTGVGPPEHQRRLLDHLLRRCELRAGPRYGEFIGLMALAALEVLTPWQRVRRTAHRMAAGLGGGPDPGEARAEWIARMANVRRRVIALLEELAASPPLRLPGRVSKARRSDRLEVRLRQRTAWWRRQIEAVGGALALEESLWMAYEEIRRLTASAAALAAEERRQLLEEMEALIGWLEQPGGPPVARHTSLLSAEERLAAWTQEIQAAARRLVPGQIETITRWKALPGRRAPWRLVRPQRLLLRALDDTARPSLLAALQEAEATHRAAVHDMERARQVIAFSQELAEREGESGRAAAREALANVVLLVRHRYSWLSGIRSLVADRASQAMAVAWYKVHLRLERDRFGLWRYVAREGVRQALLAGRDMLAVGVKALARAAQRGGRRLTGYLLGRIGWEQAPARELVHVERREVLSEILGLDLAPHGLPLIYQRLFRAQPVEDPRFLVGREAEMAAMGELRRRWEQRRPACALLIGERGSGKTSLLNCALARVFPDVEVVRTEFRERLWTAEQMRRFLEEQVRLQPNQRAVVILEELERAWLRRIGGYEALRTLLGQIVLTSRQVLWIVAVNQAAFRLLNAALGLETYFSHRINAGAVKQQDLQQAILTRHNLTGLRLHFLAPQHDRATGGWRRRLGLQLSPEQIFFQALYRESEGLFRSAFELWLKHIERSQDGVLYVKPLERPDYDSLLADLSLPELFTLQALLQHGSLTPEEHAQVFALGVAASLDRLEILEDRELIEPDPGRSGFRVRPEAARAVRVALHRRNLL